MSDLEDLTAEIVRFRDERDWAQFHTPKNLATALAIEASELQEVMLWKSDAEVEKVLQVADTRERMREEIADILIFTLLLCDKVGLHPAAAVREKMKKNRVKYPVDLSRGSAKKWDELRTGGLE